MADLDNPTPRYRLALVQDGDAASPTTYPTLASPRAVARYVHGWYAAEADREWFVMLALDARNRLIGANVVSVGSLNTTLAHPREVFKAAILLNAAAIVVAHNHPSGESQPSADDDAVTSRLCEVGELLDMPLHDHVIVTPDGRFYSYRDEGAIG